MMWQLLMGTTAASRVLAGGGGNPAATYDSLFAGMKAVYSLKKRVAAYSGPAVRIYDTGTTTEQDVGFNSDGRLDTFSVTGIARVTTWYDQSGNGLDLTQTTVARMPRLLAQGGPAFQPTVEFRSLEDNYLLSVPVYNTALAIARPIVLLGTSYESNGLFEILAHVSNSASHLTPYSRWSMGRNAAYKIDSRWNGGVKTGTGAGPVHHAGWQPLLLDGATSATNVRWVFGDAATFTDYADSASNTYGTAARLQLGANIAGGEGASETVSEMIIADAAPTGTHADIFAEVDKWNSFVDTATFNVNNTYFNDLPYLTPIMGGGMVKRNPSYSGPAIRVYNASTFAEVDVNFDGNGLVTGTRPYGADTRLHTIYDQWGSENLVVVGTPDATLIEEDSTYKCWRIQFNGGSYLATANTTTTPGAWVKDTCVWALGLIRTASRSVLHNVWGVESSTNYMTVGLWIELTDLHHRLDSGSALDVLGTHYTTNASRVANVLAPVVGMVGGQNNGAIQCDAHPDTTTRSALSYPLTWTAGKPLCLGGWTGLGSHCLEQVTEFHYFDRDDHSAGMTINMGSSTVLTTRMKQVLV